MGAIARAATHRRSLALLVCAVALVATDGSAQGTALERRTLTLREAEALARDGAGPGTSGVDGIQTTVLAGDPTREGLYTIMLHVPPRTRIEAHHHPDERVATVVSGTWSIGYGDRFDERALHELPPGSFYTEPAGEPHFALTHESTVVVHITGYGPTGTRYESETDAR